MYNNNNNFILLVCIITIKKMLFKIHLNVVEYPVLWSARIRIEKCAGHNTWEHFKTSFVSTYPPFLCLMYAQDTNFVLDIGTRNVDKASIQNLHLFVLSCWFQLSLVDRHSAFWKKKKSTCAYYIHCFVIPAFLCIIFIISLLDWKCTIIQKSAT